METQDQRMRRALAGDRLAAERLLEPHRRMVTAIAYQALGNADDAWDVAQETLVYALLRLSELRVTRKLAAWLKQLTLSHCADYRRRRGTRRLGEPITFLNEAREETDFAQRLTIRQAIAHLSEAHRTTLLLHYTGGWSLEEVASLLAVPVNTVRSRLMAAKRLLRADLQALFPSAALAKGKRMPTDTFALSETHTSLIEAAFPGARLLSVQNDPEPWQPFTPRVRLTLAKGGEKIVDFRGDITPERAALLPVLDRLNIPGPRILQGPVPTGNGFTTLCEPARGENLTLWALGGTPHRIRLATERAFEGIDRLQGITDALQADPIGATLPRRTLADEVEILTEDAKWNADPWLAEEGAERREWLQDPWFAGALARVQAAIADIAAPLVYTNYLHFFPQVYRIQPGDGPFDEPLGWPGDPHYLQNPLVEFTEPFGHFGDPLLGLAMVWVYDCYPFVHTGFVEQFLWRRGVTQREFAPRLALKALQIVARDLPVGRPAQGSDYWEGLRGWVEQALGWM
ncbi:MAG TPA: RNA polymerase sigma factor [Chthonomonadaceae bacterium]|nr:RNA polymerase sigma factor [Chthonomonadaceae bacterium]